MVGGVAVAVAARVARRASIESTSIQQIAEIALVLGLQIATGDGIGVHRQRGNLHSDMADSSFAWGGTVSAFMQLTGDGKFEKYLRVY